MRVLAAAFEDPSVARHVLDELRHRYGLRPTDVSMAPLGSGDQRPPLVVVAGRFYDEVVSDIHATVRRHGGQVVSDIDERWTRSPAGQEALDPDPDARRN